MLTFKRAKELFRYDTETGKLYWRVSRGKAKAGQEVGCPCASGRKTKVDGQDLLVHRIVWLLQTGKIPSNEIDHISGNKTDNRLKKLRDVTRPVNAKNMPIPVTNTSGTVGVYLNKKAQKWVAQIYVDGKWKYLGFYTSKDDAIKAREQANIEFGFHPNHGKRVSHHVR